MYNYGHSGWDSSDLINGLNGEASQLNQAVAAHPNIALVWIGSNDLWYLYEYGPEPMTTAAEQDDLRNYTANIDTILRQLTSHGITVFIALLDDQSKRPVVADPPNPSQACHRLQRHHPEQGGPVPRHNGGLLPHNDLHKPGHAIWGRQPPQQRGLQPDRPHLVLGHPASVVAGA